MTNQTSSNTLRWTKDTGWGTRYTARGELGVYIACKTGGRFTKWELRLRKTGDESWSGERVTAAGTLRFCKEVAEAQNVKAIGVKAEA